MRLPALVSLKSETTDMNVAGKNTIITKVTVFTVLLLSLAASLRLVMDSLFC